MRRALYAWLNKALHLRSAALTSDYRPVLTRRGRVCSVALSGSTAALAFPCATVTLQIIRPLEGGSVVFLAAGGMRGIIRL